jgi:deoxyribodipyrimidine photo-lyase
MTTAIWWIRRDLRLRDNPALHQAQQQADTIIPLFILDETLLQSPYMSEKRIAFLYDGLRALGESLQVLNSRLLIRRGQPLAVFNQLAAEIEFSHIFAQEDFTPYAKKRDQAIAANLPLILTSGTTIRPPSAVRKNDGHPYVVFTPYKKKWLGQALPRQADLHSKPEQLQTPSHLSSDRLPDAPTPPSVIFPAGEAEGYRRLENFTRQGITDYASQRNLMAVNGTSTLSPYLRFGMVSAREAAVLALQAKAKSKESHGREGADTWLSELIWREFYIQILDNFPAVRQQNFYSQYDHIQWRNNQDEFAAWCAGQTGYPIVDAAMRQLNNSGWMHNRARMIVASFLVKDLLIDWRWGEKQFMQKLIDGDPAANNGGWQWAAGTGTDAAPYFRIFNPTSQSQKYDPDGNYIRRWIPELRAVPDKYIHEPWKMPALIQREANCQLGDTYPMPLVDHKAARERTLRAYKNSRELSQDLTQKS